MKIQDLFDLLRSSDDLLSFFENVQSPQQLVSRLEQLKRQDPEGLFDCIEDLRLSVANTLEANLEMNGALTDEPDASDDLLKDLNEFSKDLGDTDVPPATDEKPPESENSSSADAK